MAREEREREERERRERGGRREEGGGRRGEGLRRISYKNLFLYTCYTEALQLELWTIIHNETELVNLLQLKLLSFEVLGVRTDANLFDLTNVN